MATITINKGDTLSGIASKYGTSAAAIASANGITNPNVIKAGASLTIPDRPGVTPTSAPGNISQAPKPSATAAVVKGVPATPSQGSMTDFQTTLKNALNEAGKNRLANNYQLAGGLTGGTPGTLGSVVDMIRSGPSTDVASTFKTVVDSVGEQQKNSLDLLKTFADDGSLAEMPDASLMAMAKSAGLPEGTALAWKARIAASAKMSDQEKQLTLQKLKADIANTNSEIANRGKDNGPGKGVVLTSGITKLFNDSKGEDKKISSDTYQSGLKDWIANGGTPADFFLSFPQEMYLTPQEMTRLPASIQQKTPSTSTTQWQSEGKVWSWLSTPEAQQMSDEDKRQEIMQNGFNPESFGL